MSRPLIGITCNFLPSINDPASEAIAAPGQSWELIAQDYVDSVEKCGGNPILLPVHSSPKYVPEVVSHLDGILISGGHDVSPMLYGERYSEKCGVIDEMRDAYETALALCAISRNIPLLGICRGIQLLNTALGGTLYQDLPSLNYPKHSIWAGNRNAGTHKTEIIEGTPLASILEIKETWVNSFHHQAVKDIAPGLAVCAKSIPDSIIEGVYMPNKDFALAVQWHPEMMYDNALQAKIFTAFVRASSKER